MADDTLPEVQQRDRLSARQWNRLTRNVNTLNQHPRRPRDVVGDGFLDTENPDPLDNETLTEISRTTSTQTVAIYDVDDPDTQVGNATITRVDQVVAVGSGGRQVTIIFDND